MSRVTEVKVVVLREDGEPVWRVFASVDGVQRITTPRFNSAGAAGAYADLLLSGYRQPEFADESVRP